jgi:ribosomal protein L12E/L44/L45/RPP1/RPP2
VFNKIVTRNNYLIIEGRLVEGPMDWLKNKAKNLTTKVTADKLNSAWQKAGSPTDSEQLKKFLTDQGVATEVVDKVYTDMKLPATAADPAAAGADPAAAGAAGTQQSQDAAALDPKKAETLYAKVKKDILTLDKKSQKQITAYLQKQLGTA